MTASRLNNPSYARPTHIAERPSPLCPGALYLPLQSPPNTSPPSFPSRPAISIPSGWTRTEHALSAAYPRTFLESTGKLVREDDPFQQGEVPPNESKDDRKKRIAKEVDVAAKMRINATIATDEQKQPGLWVAAEQWIRDGVTSATGEGVTLVVTHANGLTKESWIPTLRRVLSGPPISPTTFGSPPLPHPEAAQSLLRRRVEIDEIWLLDDIHHGASIDLNKEVIGPVHNWVDGGRDVIAAIEQTVRRDRPEKKVIGAGYSFGGNAMVQAAHARPDLFEALFLVEPMCPPARGSSSDFSGENIAEVARYHLLHGSIKRRDRWPSIEAATRVRSSPFFSPWHDESFDLWLSHGLVPVPGDSSGAVQLSTPKWGESAVFAETEGLGVGWDKLSELQVPVGFVMSGNPIATHGEEPTREMVWRPPVCANERITSSGHLIAHEKPDELADALRRFLGNVLLPEETKAHL